MERRGQKYHRERLEEALREEIAGVLTTMGLRLSPEKTLITHIDEGLDFLGWRIQRRIRQQCERWLRRHVEWRVRGQLERWLRRHREWRLERRRSRRFRRRRWKWQYRHRG